MYRTATTPLVIAPATGLVIVLVTAETGRNKLIGQLSTTSIAMPVRDAKAPSEAETWEPIKTAAFRGLPTQAVIAEADLAEACVVGACVVVAAADGDNSQSWQNLFLNQG